MVLHIKYFPENCQKSYLNTSKFQQKQINCNQEQIIVTTSTKSCKQNKNTLYEPHKILDLEGKERRWVLREKNGGKWVGKGGSVRMRDGWVGEDEGWVDGGRSAEYPKNEGWIGRGRGRGQRMDR